MSFGIGLLAAAAGAVGARQWLLNREVRQHHHESFEGVIYRLGEAAVAERRSVNPRATVICMHGFVEDMRYFTRYYSDPDIQLILVNSGSYHLPVTQPEYAQAEWAKTPVAPPGSIEYDAKALIQALEHLPRSPQVRVHGHSRGGAVVLQAAALRPDLFRDVEVVLEAPVLPQARPKGTVPPGALWFVPFFLPLWRSKPINSRNAKVWGPLDDPRKRELIEGLPFNPKTARTFIDNLRDLGNWMQQRDHSLYANLHRGVILVPERDKVLDPRSMRESGQRAGALQVVDVPGCSHFVLLDRPDVIPPLPAAVAAEAEQPAG